MMRSSAFRRLAASYVSAFRTTPARCLSTRALDSSLKSSTIDCFVWGKGSDGVLGLGDRKDQRDPEIVEFENHDLSIVSFAAGPSHSAAVDSDGKLWTFGKNEYGKLGAKIDKSTTHVIEPVRVVVGNDQERVVAVDCGEYHTVALTESGAVYSWGWGGHWLSGSGALGHGSKESVSTPKRVEALDGVKAIEVACGKLHTIVRTDDGKLYTWGKGEYGRLGLNSNSDCDLPQIIDALEDREMVSIAAGSASSAAVSKAGELFVWGSNDCGQLGVGNSTNLDMFAMEGIPTIVEDLIDIPIDKVACSSRHMVACTRDGRAFVWGDRQWMVPYEISSSLVGGERVVDVAACPNLSAVITENGHLMTWGSNTSCLGHGDWDVVREPTLVEAFEGRRVVGIAGNKKHVGALVVANAGDEE